MAAITARNIPDEAIAMIKNRARRDRRSMEQEVRSILSGAVHKRERCNLLTYNQRLLTFFPEIAVRPDHGLSG